MRPDRPLVRTVRGTAGLLRCGFQPAARLGAWTLARLHPHGYGFESAVMASAAYWVRQPGLDVVLVVGRDTWTWRSAAVSVSAAGVAATLDGAPEIARGGAAVLPPWEV